MTVENDWFIHKLNVLKDDYLRRDEENREAEASIYRMWDADKAKSDALIRDLCRALERAQEIIITIGEASGDAALLKEARVYANVIGGLTTGLGPEAYDHLDDKEIERLLAKIGPRPAPHYSTGPEKARKAATAKKKGRR